MAKHLMAKCVTCKMLRRKPLEQLMGQLPKLRVAVGFPAFSNTAIDMLGLLQIRVARKTVKEAHAIIFTCAGDYKSSSPRISNRQKRRYLSHGLQIQLWNKLDWSSTLLEGKRARMGHPKISECRL